MTAQMAETSSNSHIQIYQAYHSYMKVAATLRHKNRLQAFYKSLMSIWMLILLFAIGYAVSFHPEIFHSLPFVALMCCASLMVTGVIWYLDMIVVERAIGTTVMAGLSLESTNRWIPDFYHTVSKMHHLLGYVNIKATFYAGCFFIQLLLLLSICSFYSISDGQFIKASLTMVIPILMGVLFFFSLNAVNKKMDPYKRTFVAQESTQKEQKLYDLLSHGKNLIFNLYHNLGLFENQYDAITSKYRNIALIWVLGIIPSMFFIQWGKFTVLQIDCIMGPPILCVIGVIGICLIWKLDIEVYHRFWCAAYIQEFRMEEKYKFLASMKSRDSTSGLLSHWNIYTLKSILLLVTAAILSLHSIREMHYLTALFFVLFYSVAFLGVIYYMRRSYKRLKARFYSLLPR